MVWVKFSDRYDHRWPSRALTHYRPDGGTHGDGVYNVKREVADAAKVAGKGTKAKSPAKASSDGPERETVDGVDGRDPSQDRDDARRDELEPGAASGASDGLPERDSAG